jgi:hypothetical protein
MNTKVTALTPWFPAETKPVRKGPYMIHGTYRNSWYSYWTGKHWGLIETSPNRAFIFRKYASLCQHKRWRGLSADAMLAERNKQ